MRRKLVLTFISLGALALLAAMAFSLASAGPAAAVTDAVIASGLDNPRGIAFGPDGALYVAEAGEGGDTPCVNTPAEGQPPPTPYCYGATGAITKVDGGIQTRIAEGMPSLAYSSTDETDGTEATGPHDVTVDANGNVFAIIGLGADPAMREPKGPLGAHGMEFGQLVAVTGMSATEGAATWQPIVDVSAYELSDNPDGGAIDSNPYSLMALDDAFAVVDAGGNSLLHVPLSGTISTLATFPTRTVEFPPGSGDMVAMESVPTSVSSASGGGYLVGELTGFPFPAGGANVYHVPAAGGTPTVVESGLTNVMDVAEYSSNLFVTQLTTGGLMAGPPGNVVMIPDGGAPTPVAADLFFPSSGVIGPDGALYISVNGILPNTGQVIRVTVLPTAVGLAGFAGVATPPLALVAVAFLALAALFGLAFSGRRRAYHASP
jgi:hypothetical protein